MLPFIITNQFKGSPEVSESSISVSVKELIHVFIAFVHNHLKNCLSSMKGMFFALIDDQSI